jgi:hypothetical protein
VNRVGREPWHGNCAISLRTHQYGLRLIATQRKRDGELAAGLDPELAGRTTVLPNEVFASAPGGSDSMASVSACGADFMKSRLRLGIVAEHAASMRPHAVTAMTRLMIQTTSAAWGPPLPRTRP